MPVHPSRGLEPSRRPHKIPITITPREDKSLNEQPIFPPPGGRSFPIVFAAGLAFIAGGFGLHYGYPGAGRRAGTDAPGPGCGYGRPYVHSAGYAGHCGYRYGGGSGRSGGGGNRRRANENPGTGGYGRAGSYGSRCAPADADGCAYAAAFANQYAGAAADRCAAAHWYAVAAAYAGIAAADSRTGGYRYAYAADGHAGTDAGAL